MNKIIANRIKRVISQMKDSGRSSALLLSSAPSAIKSRDTHYPYRQNSDFYYLTSSTAQNLLLFISTSHGAILFAPAPDPVKELWDGAPPSPKLVAKRIGAELVITNEPRKEILARLKGIETLYFQNVSGSVAWQIAKSLMEISSHMRGELPSSFSHSDCLLEEMRLYKETEEIHAIAESAHITNDSIFAAMQFVEPGNYEYEVGAMIDFGFKLHNATPGFNTIVAAGPSAATLHYEAGTRKLKNEDLVLIDCGAEYNMYNADITRVVPVSGKFTMLQRELYDIVLKAQHAAIKATKPNTSIRQVYLAAAHEITVGLVSMGVLRGKVSQLMKKEAFKKYFPHGIGHPLGLDVHDVGKLRGNTSTAKLKPGMVLTIEPGLYFQKKTGKIQPCGIRIEDDVLVTSRGSHVLTDGFPKYPVEIENENG